MEIWWYIKVRVFYWLSKLFRKEHTWALHESQEFLGLAYLNCNSQCKFPAFQESLDFCSVFLGFPGVSMSCFSMKARNFHTWHSHSCLSWLFWVRFVWTKSTLSAKAQSPLLAFQAFLGRTFRSFQESQEFPCFPGFSRLSSVKKSREKPRKPGSPGFSGVSALFLAFFGKGSYFQSLKSYFFFTSLTVFSFPLHVL